ncbi:MAG: tyrosine-type recombinase/integrase [Pirellulales bacterium]
MPRLTKSVPKYRKHRATGQAVITLNGKDHYLGPHGTKVSKREYDRLIGEWQANGRRAPAEHSDLTISELLAAYLRHAKGYYRRADGTPTDTIYAVKATLRVLREAYGPTRAVDYGPLALKALQQRMVEGGVSRSYINDHTKRIRRIFRWAVSEEMLPPSVVQALETVQGLRWGRTKARETGPVLPVDNAVVQTTLPHRPEVVSSMVMFQRATGCRPEEVCILRPCDVDTDGEVWIYRPSHHKVAHLGRERLIPIGPKGQAILRPYLLREKETYCFRPTDSEKKRRQTQHEALKTPLQYGNRPGTNRKRRPQRAAGARYTTDSYRRAIHRACDKAGVEHWSPNRLRHSAGTEIRKRYGLEGAQVILGHASADITQIYAERDLARAVEIMREVG